MINFRLLNKTQNIKNGVFTPCREWGGGGREGEGGGGGGATPVRKFITELGKLSRTWEK